MLKEDIILNNKILKPSVDKSVYQSATFNTLNAINLYFSEFHTWHIFAILTSISSISLFNRIVFKILTSFLLIIYVSVRIRKASVLHIDRGV